MYLILTIIWFIYYNYINNNNKIKRNMISATHSVITILLCYFNQYALVYYISTSYFIYDSILQIYNNIMNRASILMLFHHVISIYALQYLYDYENHLLLMYCYMILEISNIPMYIMYHLVKTRNRRKYLVNFVLLCEIFSFMILRVVYLGYVYVNNITRYSYDIIVIATLLYILTLVWLIGMINQFKDNIAEMIMFRY